MKHIFFSCAIAVGVSLVTPSLAQAACLAEYKAKRESPFALFYDTAQISGPCTVANATAQLRSALASQGLTLLKVLSVREG